MCQPADLELLQGVRYLWDVAAGPPNARINPDEQLHIGFLRNRLLSEKPSEDAKDVYSLFWELELGATPVVSFVDCDGEPFSLITRHVVFVSAPKEIVDEGRREVHDEDGL